MPDPGDRARTTELIAATERWFLAAGHPALHRGLPGQRGRLHPGPARCWRSCSCVELLGAANLEWAWWINLGALVGGRRRRRRACGRSSTRSGAGGGRSCPDTIGPGRAGRVRADPGGAAAAVRRPGRVGVRSPPSSTSCLLGRHLPRPQLRARAHDPLGVRADHQAARRRRRPVRTGAAAAAAVHRGPVHQHRGVAGGGVARRPPVLDHGRVLRAGRHPVPAAAPARASCRQAARPAGRRCARGGVRRHADGRGGGASSRPRAWSSRCRSAAASRATCCSCCSSARPSRCCWCRWRSPRSSSSSASSPSGPR